MKRLDLPPARLDPCRSTAQGWSSLLGLFGFYTSFSAPRPEASPPPAGFLSAVTSKLVYFFFRPRLLLCQALPSCNVHSSEAGRASCSSVAWFFWQGQELLGGRVPGSAGVKGQRALLVVVEEPRQILARALAPPVLLCPEAR